MYYPDVEPWQHGPNHVHLGTSPDVAQQGGHLYDANTMSTHAQMDLNAADPSAQALLRFLMQSDYEFSMR